MSVKASDPLKPHFEEIQAHYDMSNEFFTLFLDPTRTYSCAYFERDDMTLEEAQLAKIDLALDGLDLRPGMTLLDIGFGWGPTMKRAVETLRRRRPGSDVEPATSTLGRADPRARRHPRSSAEVLLRGWEEFDEPGRPGRSIEAFERFGSTGTRLLRDVPTGAARRRPDGAADDHGSPAEALAGDGHPDHDGAI